MPLQPIDKSNIASRVYAEIRDGLIAGKFQPGERFILHEMATQFGVSVTPVREALLRLVSERALEMHTAKMIGVPPLSVERYLELRTIRLALEPLAVELATPNIRASDLVQILESHRLFTESAQAHDPTARMLSNQTFHFQIYQLCQLPTLVSIIENLWASMGPILSAYYAHMKHVHNHEPDAHQPLISAIQAGNAKAAAKAMASDITGAGKSIISFLEQTQSTGRLQ